MLGFFLTSLLVVIGCTEYDLTQREDLDPGPNDTAEPSVPSEIEHIEEEWTLDGHVPADILFFADTSASMLWELFTLGDAVKAFVNRLVANGVDWQILPITRDSGCTATGVLTQATPSYATKFATAVTQIGFFQAYDEAGLFLSELAIDKSLAGTCNVGFLRENALLHIIFLSDENDESPGHDAGSDYWQSYVDSIYDLKGSSTMVRFSAIGGPVPDGCDGAEPGYGYHEAVQATEGAYLSICDDWWNQIDLLADASIKRDLFELQRIPIVETIQVQVNDVAHPQWQYEADLNAIRFLQDAPTGGDHVRIRYSSNE